MKRILVKNPRGQDLVGVLFSCFKPLSKLIIICHGFKGTKEGRGKAFEMAEFFAKEFDVFLFDFRGCGESQGKFEDITLTGQIEDLNSIVKWALENGYKSIGCAGRSFGGTTVICTACENKDISSVVVWSAPAELELVFNKEKFLKKGSFYITYSNGKELRIKSGFFKDIKNFDVYKSISLISPRPVFVLHGGKDEVVPVETAYKLFEAAREPKRVKIIEGDDHIFSKNYKLVWKLTFDWFKKTL